MASLNSPTSSPLGHFLSRFQGFSKIPGLRALVQLYRSVQRLISVLRKSSDKRCPTLPASSSQSVPQFAAGLCSPTAIAPVELVSMVGSSSQHHSRLDVNDDAVSPPEIDPSDPTLIIGGLVVSPSQDILEQSQPEIALQASEVKDPNDWKLQPIMPEDLPRRKSYRAINPDDASYEVEPGQTSFKTENRLPEGWVRHTNCEGHPFFHQEEKNILTDAWLYEDSVQNFIVPLAYYIHSRAQECFHHVVRTCQLVVCIAQFDVEENDDGRRCGYYFAHHQQRNLLWMEQFEINYYLRDIKGGRTSHEHAKLLIEHQYWKHFEYFDDVQQPSPENWATFLSIVTVAHADMLTSTSSTCNESLESLEKMREISEPLRTPDADHRASAWVLGRFMGRLVKDRFLNFYGQNGARLNSFDSVYREVIEHSLLFDIFSPVLFSAPNVHLKTLENMWVDRVTRHEPWKDLVAKLTAEWEQHKMFGTILLTTNAAFLAIPSVDSNDPGPRVVKLLSYMSIIAGLGCIMLGSLLHRQHKTRTYSVMDAAEFLSGQDGKYGLEALAVMYSLPYALSMWGTIFFLAAFLVMGCISQSAIIITAIMGSWLLVTFLIWWCVKMAWQPGKWSNSMADKLSSLKKIYNQCAKIDYRGKFLQSYSDLSSSIRDSIPGIWRGRDLEAQNYQ